MQSDHQDAGDLREATTIVACEQAVHRLYHVLDQADYDGVLAQFDAEGVWERGGVALTGHAQILASLRKRPATQVIRHVVSNFLVSARDGHNGQDATAVFYLTAYQFDSGATVSLPVKISRPFLFADVSCQLRCDENGRWRIRQLGLRRVFEFASDSA